MERINKFLAHAGVGSRRHCDELIIAGRVKINDLVVVNLATRVDPAKHKVSVDDQPVKAEKPVYWLVNKPPGYLCTNHDPGQRPLAHELIPHVDQRVYTVGRLDEGSEGLLLMTNDGDLAMKLMHPRYQIEKTYEVLVAGSPSPADLQQLLDGVWLAEGKVRAKSVRRVKGQGDSTLLRIVLCEGKNREIRRMLAKLEHKVLKLKRMAIGPVQLDRLPRGKARKLHAQELLLLQKLVSHGEAKLEAARKAVAVAGEEPVEEAPPPVLAPKAPKSPKAASAKLPPAKGPLKPRPRPLAPKPQVRAGGVRRRSPGIPPKKA
ncbi:MAG: pseudouridine synthase [Gemmataceae bacterium]